MPHPSVLQYGFRNSEALGQVLNTRRQTTIRQLSLKPLQCDLLLVEHEQISFSFTRVNSPLHVMGAKGKGWIEFSFILQPGQQNFFAHQRAISQTTLFGFDPTREVDLIVPANAIICVIQISQNAFDHCAALMQRDDLNVRFLKTNFVTVPDMLDGVQPYLKKLYSMALHHPEYFSESRALHILEDFLPLLIDSIPHSSTPLNLSLQSPRRFNLVKEAEEYMRSHLEAPITLISLCNALHTSERPLSYGFREVFGISPMAYLKVLRLQAVRTQLQAVESSTLAIADIARRFRFRAWDTSAEIIKPCLASCPQKP